MKDLTEAFEANVDFAGANERNALRISVPLWFSGAVPQCLKSEFLRRKTIELRIVRQFDQSFHQILRLEVLQKVPPRIDEGLVANTTFIGTIRLQSSRQFDRSFHPFLKQCQNVSSWKVFR